MNKKLYTIPSMKWLALHGESELLNATMNGDTILDDDPNNPSDNPWDEGLGKRNVWDEE
ncbi:MAG: hypothetical protein IJM81_08110 [Prevotella sp.]|nr:hypothetical protein [Prevotella sp.]